MSRNRLLALLLVCCIAGQLAAQDQLPGTTSRDVANRSSKQLRQVSSVFDTVAVHIALPAEFQDRGKNEIADSIHSLAPVLERLRLIRSDASDDTLRIAHIGDSHIRGHIYPQATGNRLTASFGAISYMDMGVNGATCLTFTHPDRIAAIANLKPELLILSFGTNESHNRHYAANVHYQQIDELVKLLRSALPTVPILLTTPPGSYESFRKRRRRRTYAINPRTAIAAETIKNYARAHDLAVWDLYQAVGGSKRASRNWLAAGLMRPDHVHYLPEGYVLQGELLYEAIIKAYNNYVSQ